MKGYLDNDEFLSLINSDVYKMLDKSQDYTTIGNIIFEAAIKCNPVVLSLERFFIKYETLLNRVY
jgi:hypothetical protein